MHPFVSAGHLSVSNCVTPAYNDYGVGQGKSKKNRIGEGGDSAKYSSRW